MKLLLSITALLLSITTYTYASEYGGLEYTCAKGCVCELEDLTDMEETPGVTVVGIIQTCEVK